MITRLDVDGFKSLREFAMDLEPFTVMIGPNSAGKSNILEALGLLSRLVTLPLSEAFKQGRGRVRDQFSRHGSEVVSSMTFRVDFLIAGTHLSAPDFREHTRWRYVLRLGRRMVGRLEQIVVQEESLSAILEAEDRWALAHPEMASWFRYGHSQPHLVFDRQVNSASQQLEFVRRPVSLTTEHPPGETAVALGQIFLEEHVLLIADLEQVRSFSPDSIHVLESSEQTDAHALARDGSNLPTVLAALSDVTVGAIRADLASLIPVIASFEVTTDDEQGAVRLDLILSSGERLPARLASGGTIRILALLAALRMSPRTPILCLEEPENGVYPARLRALLACLQRTTSTHEDEAEFRADLSHGGGLSGAFWNLLATQILLTTHSPVALAALRSEPRHLRFIDMVVRDGWRVSRARGVVPKVSRAEAGQLVSVREIDRLLQSVQSGEEGA